VKRIVVCATLIVALAVPTVAGAWTHVFDGKFDPSGTIELKIRKLHGRSKLTTVKFREVPISCDQGNETTSGNVLKQRVPVEGGKFRLTARATSADDHSTLKLVGRLTHHGRRAKGTMRVHGAVVPLDGGTHGRCDTGRLRWHASR
jgi:hypothetical protein